MHDCPFIFHPGNFFSVNHHFFHKNAFTFRKTLYLCIVILKRTARKGALSCA